MALRWIPPSEAMQSIHRTKIDFPRSDPGWASFPKASKSQQFMLLPIARELEGFSFKEFSFFSWI
jgi:hypothetical protein